jgi:hypothetical protein
MGFVTILRKAYLHLYAKKWMLSVLDENYNVQSMNVLL